MRVAALAVCTATFVLAVQARNAPVAVAMAAAIFWLGWEVERMIRRR